MKPDGASPVGDGGPIVGPYQGAALTTVTLGAPSPASVTYGSVNAVTYTVTLAGMGNTHRNLTVNWAAPGAPAGVTASTDVANPNANCNLSKVNCRLVLTLDTSTTTPVLSRSLTVTVDGVLRSNSQTLTVGPKAVTVTARNQSKTYDTALSLGTSAVTTSGLVNSDSVTSVTPTSAGAAVTATVAGSPYRLNADSTVNGLADQLSLPINLTN